MLPLEVGWQLVTLLIRTIPKPIIARVNGYTIGGGQYGMLIAISALRQSMRSLDKQDRVWDLLIQGMELVT